MDWEIEFYQKENGEIPVEDFLLGREIEKALSYKLDYERRCQDE